MVLLLDSCRVRWRRPLPEDWAGTGYPEHELSISRPPGLRESDCEAQFCENSTAGIDRLVHSLPRERHLHVLVTG